jgi:hypothetical protein
MHKILTILLGKFRIMQRKLFIMNRNITPLQKSINTKKSVNCLCFDFCVLRVVR